MKLKSGFGLFSLGFVYMNTTSTIHFDIFLYVCANKVLCKRYTRVLSSCCVYIFDVHKVKLVSFS
jgi:hypothetical protein